MDSASTPKPVTPQPGLIKAIGVLNILFGGMLLLCGLGCLNMAAPAIIGGRPIALEPKGTQAFFDEMHRQRIQDLSDREQAALTKVERDRLKAEREEAEAKRPDVEKEIDFPKVNAELRWLNRYLWYDVLSGPILNLLLVVSGVGLVLRKNWARVLAIGTAALKIVRLVALGTFLGGFVIPHVGGALDSLLKTEIGRDVIRHAIEQQQAQQGGPPGAPQPSPEEFARLLRGSGTFSAIFFLCFGAIFPVLVLILLTRPGARAACVSDTGDVAGPGPFGENGGDPVKNNPPDQPLA